MSADERLMALYRQTTFEAETPGGAVSVRPGETSAPLDAVLEAHQAETWAHLTAWNPGPVRRSREENERRQKALEAELTRRGLVWFPGRGVGDDGWAEAGALVVGIGRGDAEALGRAFGQAACVGGRLGGPAELWALA